MLINCVAYEHGTKLADIPVSAIAEWLSRPGCFVWVALKDATDEELSEMQRQFSLHDLAVEDARHGHQRPKVEEYGSTMSLDKFGVVLVKGRNGDTGNRLVTKNRRGVEFVIQ